MNAENTEVQLRKSKGLFHMTALVKTDNQKVRVSH